MRIRMLLIMVAMVVVAGCQGPSTSAEPTTTTTTTSRKPVRTTTPPPRTTPKPDPSTPHRVVRFRLEIVDANHDSAMIPATSNPNPVRDPGAAQRIRQDPGLATDKAAQQRAAASLDCGHEDPLVGKDDPSLPLTTCGATEFAEFLGPVLLDGGMVAGATYGPGGPVPGHWDVTVDLTPAGSRILAGLTPKSVNVLLFLLFDGQVAGAASVPEHPAGTLEITYGSEDDAHQVAAILDNR